MEITNVASEITRRRLGETTVVEYQIVVESHDHTQIDDTSAKIEAGLNPSTFNDASAALANAVVSPSTSDTIETAAGMPSLAYATIQSDNDSVEAMSSQEYDGPSLTLSDNASGSTQTELIVGRSSNIGITVGAVVAVVAVVALVAFVIHTRRSREAGASLDTPANPEAPASQLDIDREVSFAQVV